MLAKYLSNAKARQQTWEDDIVASLSCPEPDPATLLPPNTGAAQPPERLAIERRPESLERSDVESDESESDSGSGSDEEESSEEEASEEAKTTPRQAPHDAMQAISDFRKSKTTEFTAVAKKHKNLLPTVKDLDKRGKELLGTAMRTTGVKLEKGNPVEPTALCKRWHAEAFAHGRAKKLKEEDTKRVAGAYHGAMWVALMISLWPGGQNDSDVFSKLKQNAMDVLDALAEQKP